MANVPTHVNRSTESAQGTSVFVCDRDDGVRSRLELQLDFGTPASVRAPPFGLVRPLRSTALTDSTVENHLDRLVGGKSFAEILVEVGMPARYDKHIAAHSLLGLGAGNCSPLRAVSRDHGAAHRSL